TNVVDVGLAHKLVTLNLQKISHTAKSRRGYPPILPITNPVSSIRFENPHSLSYQASTFTVLPITRVWPLSKMQEAGWWLKSTETRGRALMARMSLSSPWAAFAMAVLMAFAVTGRSAVKVRSTRETLI